MSTLNPAPSNTTKMCSHAMFIQADGMLHASPMVFVFVERIVIMTGMRTPNDLEIAISMQLMTNLLTIIVYFQWSFESSL